MSRQRRRSRADSADGAGSTLRRVLLRPSWPSAQHNQEKTQLLWSADVLLCKVIFGLIFLLLLLILVDLEVAQLIALLGVGYDPQPVPEVVLLQVLLGEILQVPGGRNGA